MNIEFFKIALFLQHFEKSTHCNSDYKNQKPLSMDSIVKKNCFVKM